MEQSYLLAQETPEKIEVFKRRYWILFVFSTLGFFEIMMWNTWGPLAQSAKTAWEWDDSTIALLANWGVITYALSVAPVAWLSRRWGLRVAVVSCAVCITVANGLRCISTSPSVFTVMAHLCGILHGVACPVVMSCVPAVTAAWFPPGQRTTATGIMQAATNLGSAGSNLQTLFIAPTAVNSTSVGTLRHEIMQLMYAEFGVALLLLLAVLIYFPSSPPLPPSLSSSVERLHYGQGVKTIVKNWRAWVVGAVYGISVGIPAMYPSMLTVDLEDIGIEQSDAAWIGFLTVTGTCIGCVVAARITDAIYKHMKAFLIALLTASSIFFFFYVLMHTGVLPVSKGWVAFVLIGGMSLSFAASPLCTEFSVEMSYPSPEGVVHAFLTLLEHFFGFFFLLLFFVPSAGYSWVALFLLGSTTIPLIPLIFVTPEYRRTSSD